MAVSVAHERIQPTRIVNDMEGRIAASTQQPANTLATRVVRPWATRVVMVHVQSSRLVGPPTNGTHAMLSNQHGFVLFRG